MFQKILCELTPYTMYDLQPHKTFFPAFDTTLSPLMEIIRRRSPPNSIAIPLPRVTSNVYRPHQTMTTFSGMLPYEKKTTVIGPAGIKVP